MTDIKQRAQKWLKSNTYNMDETIFVIQELLEEVERLEKDCLRKQMEINRRDEVCLQCSVSYESQLTAPPEEVGKWKTIAESNCEKLLVAADQLSRYEGAVEVEGRVVNEGNTVCIRRVLKCNPLDLEIGQRVRCWVKGVE